MYSYIIKNVTILDGTGRERWKADIGIEGERIKSVGAIETTKAREIIDASGFYASPGAIDLLNHSDTHWTLFEEPSQESLLKQGITTIIGGACGSSLAPIVDGNTLRSIQKWVDISRINANWRSTAEFFAELEKHKFGVNFGTLVGHGTLRRNVMGDSASEANEDEIDRMKLLLKESLIAGAFGLSFGLAFSHGRPASRHELVSLSSFVAASNKLVAMHLKDEGREFLSSVAEAVDVARSSGANLEISHIKAIGTKAWQDTPKALDMIKSAIKEGLSINADVFPYLRTGSLLYTLVPEWVREGGKEAIIAKLHSPQERVQILDGLRALTLHYDKITIASTLRKSGLIGKTLFEAAQILGMSNEEAMLEILFINDLAVTIFGETLNEENLVEMIKEPFTMFSSDGIGKSKRGELGSNLIHPRSYGTVPKVLSYFVRDKNVLSLEEAVKKMTSMPAEKLGLRERGKIEKGYFADLIIFDPVTIRDNATYADPYEYPGGIEWVFVNGEPAVIKGSYRGALQGKILRKM